ncbi:glutathione S-transferase [Erwinia sp. BNK-24-b]|uniref:glutathione S-transferase n=1 Tax=Erwinia TaxID=551 RepID=UPI001FEF5696|nr:glutathione S-transferase [Erwinia phyllosphaerae]MBV4367519.1 glutathione S-transferase [Erwinia phyllosphaerae]
MKLIGSYTSPFVRKISVILLEKGITFEFINESPWTDESHVPHYNPLGKVPALVAGQETWYDSHIIAAYLEQLDIAPALMPRDRLAALKVQQLEALADGIGDAAVILLREQMRPPEQQMEGQLLRQREKILRGLDALEKEAVKGITLNSGKLNVADIATACLIGFLNFRRIVPNWCVDRPALVKLAENMFQRESFARTVPPTA